MRDTTRVYSKWSNKNVGPYVLIWEDFMETAVPEGCDIHHIDQNPDNNDILNLVCMTRQEHMRWHATHRSKETRKRLSESKKGKKWSEEQRRKINNKGENNPMYGKTFTEEHRKKISDKRRRRDLDGTYIIDKIGRCYMYIDGKRTFISLSKYEEYGIPELEQTNKWSKARREAYERRKQNEK